MSDGIIGWGIGNTAYCYNIANITVTGKDSAGSAYLGGIVGGTGNSSSSIKNCYNIGTIKSNVSGNSIGGITGCLGWDGSWTLSNCINVGQSYNNHDQLPTVDFGNSSYSFGRVVGYNDSNDKITNSISTTKEQLKNYTNEELKNKLGEEFVRDESNINNGYPILKWQLEK